jgi:hypothetical protein
MDGSDEEEREAQLESTALLLERRASITNQLRDSPYDMFTYIERAYVHSELGYPDLAAGDAYRALLLTDEVRDDSFEYHEPALEALDRYRNPRDSARIVARYGGLVERVQTAKLEDGKVELTTEQFADLASMRAFRALSISLLLCGCLKTAYEFTLRGLEKQPGDEELVQAQAYILNLARRRSRSDDIDFADFPNQGLVRREIYPWNMHEEDRYSVGTLDKLNAALSEIAPKVVAKVTELPVLCQGEPVIDENGQIATNKQLGLFAKEFIAPGETVLEEVSVLTANNRLQHPLCDACSSDLPELGAENQAIACEECYTTMFCSEYCHNLAQATYHPSVCDKDVDAVGKNVDPKEIPNALYMLLLGRALAMSDTQDVHPLDLQAIKHIWGDFLPPEKNAVPLSPKAGPPPIWTLPFTFESSVTGPIHLLEKMDIDIFSSLDKYDLWTLNTLYAKFRGTASARVSKRDGRPEVAAVHPFWCLANHDCDPNVQWEWGGRMKLWARDKRIMPNKCAGIKAGEEILNHYCDIELPVQQRREWAQGSLGGFCLCSRCMTEAAEEANRAEGRGSPNTEMLDA